MSVIPNAVPVTENSFTESEAMVTVDQLKTRYFFGIPFTDKEEKLLPPETLQHAINSALSYLELKLDIIIRKRAFNERYDFRSVDYGNFCFIQMKKRPIHDVESFKAKYPNAAELIDFPKDWIVIEKEAGQLQLSPVQGTFNGLVVTQGGSYLPLLFGTRGQWPHLFEIKYTAGFCDDQIPVIINEMIGMQAAIRGFEILADAALGGVPFSGENVNLDGAGVGKQTSASGTNSIYAARLKAYQDQMKEYISTVKKYYNGIPFVVA